MERHTRGRSPSRPSPQLVTELKRKMRLRGAITASSLFWLMDVSRTDRVPLGEFRKGLHKAGIYFTDREQEQLFNTMDTDNDGRISWAEMQVGLMNQGPTSTEAGQPHLLVSPRHEVQGSIDAHPSNVEAHGVPLPGPKVTATPAASPEKRRQKTRRRVEIALRIRPRQPGPESAHPAAFVVSGRTIRPNNLSRGVYCSSRGELPQQPAGGMVADAIFDEWASTSEVHAALTRPLARSLLQGESGAVVAYGATGSGKTYTMLGPRLAGLYNGIDPGVTPHSPGEGLEGLGLASFTALEIFKALELPQHSHSRSQVRLHVSYYEVYQERVWDLLAPRAAGSSPQVGSSTYRGGGTAIAVRYSSERGFYADGCEVLCRSFEAVEALLARASQQRRVGATGVNAESNRAHGILTFRLSSSASVGSGGDAPEKRKAAAERSAVLSLVDLAGSERVAATRARGLRLAEACGINSSLLSLSQLIQALEPAAARPNSQTTGAFAYNP